MSRERSPLERLTSRAARENRPLSALLELTYRCNLRCFFCYNDRNAIRSELSTGQWLTVLDQIAAMGVLHLGLSGGEPLMHPGFFEVLARARELGFATRVKTSGDLMTREVARRIRREGDPFLVELSLHGADAAVHERQTRVPGSFDRLLENARAGREEGLRIRFVVTLTRWNEAQMEAMANLGEAMGVPVRFSAEVAPRDDGDRSPLDLVMSGDGYRRYREWIGKRAGAVEDATDRPEPGDVMLTCGAAATGFTIDPLGNVLPCVQWRQSAGNVLERPLAEIWSTSPVLQAARVAIRSAVDRIGPGEVACRFCPAMAWLLEREPTREYRQEVHPLGGTVPLPGSGSGGVGEAARAGRTTTPEGGDRGAKDR